MTYIKELIGYLKNWFILAWILITIALIVDRCDLAKTKKDYRNLKELSLKENQIKKAPDSSARAEADVVRKANRDVVLAPYESELKRKGVKPKHVKSLVKTSFKTSGIVYDTLYLFDTILSVRSREWVFSDGYLAMSCMLTDSVIACPYSYSDTVTVVTHVERLKVFIPRTWLKKNRKIYTDVKLSNPNSEILRLESVILE